MLFLIPQEIFGVDRSYFWIIREIASLSTFPMSEIYGAYLGVSSELLL